MTPLIGEIQLFAGKYAPQGWAMCEGQLLSTDKYDALYSIIGTTYGGDGVVNFALPNLKSRVPIGAGKNPTGWIYDLGQSGGSETLKLSPSHIPLHGHTVAANLKVNSAAADKPSPENNYFGKTKTASPPDPEYASTSDKAMNAIGIAINFAPNTDGGTKPVNNMQLYVAVNYIIATEGMYPSRG
jgi:microcystin-dependent protein